MSLWRDELKPSRATEGTLVVLTLVAIGSLGRVVAWPRYLLWAIPAVAIGATFAFVFGKRSLGLGFGLLIALEVLTLPVIFATKKTVLGLPTPAAYRVVRDLARAGIRDAAAATPPVVAQAKYMVLVWTALILLGFLGAAWVVVRRPLGAVVSALGVVTFAGSVGDGPGRTAVAVSAVVATIAFFLAEGRQRIQRWGGGRLRVPAWFGLPTLAIASLAAVAAPALFGDTPLIQIKGALRPRVVIIKPLSDIQRQLKVDPPIEVMRVQAARPLYWRLTGLDRYDGREWLLEAHPRDVVSGPLPAPDPPATGTTVTQRVTLTSLLSPWLPAAYAARSIESQAAVEIDRPSQTLLLRDQTSPGLTYNVTSQLPKLTANTPVNLRASRDDTERLFAGYARPVIAGAATPLDMARKLERHFRQFTYSETVPAGHAVARLQQFLRDRRGYCEQFAATMTLMLRGLGIEARVGVGFLPGASVADEYVVSTKDAHAWVEAKMPGGGWTNFDPTPGRGTSSSIPQQVQPRVTAAPIPSITTNPVTTPQQQDLPDDVTRQRTPIHIPAPVVYTLIAAVIVAMAPVAKRVRRTRRRRGTPDAVVVGAYSEFIDRAREFGWTAAPAETHREFARRVSGSSNGTYGELAAITGRVVYGAGKATNDDAQRAWRTLERSVHELRERAPWWRRVIAFVDPRPLAPEGLTLRRVTSTLRRYTPTGRPSSI
jgi:transglutaminase-like putative cysteine protease